MLCVQVRVAIGAQAVTLRVSPADTVASFDVTFTFQANMNAVLAVCGSSGANTCQLDALFPGDNGQQWPHDVNEAMQSGQPAPPINNDVGRPYRCA